MNRIIVIGCPGSGKSVFSRALHSRLGLPLYHLDNLYWNEDRTTVPKEVFRAQLAQILTGEQWIIDGHYAATLPMRLARCDTVFWLDLPLEKCLSGIEARRFRPRPDLPWIETEADGDFAAYVRDCHGTLQRTIPPLLQSFHHIALHVFRSHEEAATYLASLAK